MYTYEVSFGIPYLPVYNAHPYFEACFLEKKHFNVILDEN